MILSKAESPARLIQSAFEQARQSGKPDWHRMTIAVLKNRLLTLTDGQFRETAFGAHTMRHFVKLAGNIVRLDDAGNLPVVVLAKEELTDMLPEVPPRLQIRSDLWRAIVDYSHGWTFVWDGTRARRKLVTDDLPVLPTITDNDLREWRGAFIERNSQDSDARTLELLRAWQEQTQSSKVLPRQLSVIWLTELRDKVLQRLRSWFAENNIEEPPDLIQEVVIPGPEAKGGSDVKVLRRLAIECVRVMNEQELADLRFSPGVVLRAIREIREQKKRAN